MADATIHELVALHYQGGGSDKVWAGAVVEDPAGGAHFLACWGRRGGPLTPQAKPLPLAGALKQFASKKKEKLGEGYQPIDPALYGIAATLATLHPALQAAGNRPPASTPAPGAAAAPTRLGVSHVTPLPPDQLPRVLGDPAYSLTEKVNGTRCLVAGDRVGLVAYNRRGVAQPTVPAAAQALTRLGRAFLIDGERLDGTAADAFVMFDLLEWDGADVRAWPYAQRIATLEQALTAAGLIGTSGPSVARAVATMPGLTLLTPATTPALKAAVYAEVQAAGGEGIIVRTLAAPSRPGDTLDERKLKFQGELDMIALGIKPGVGSGSVRVGLLRPADGAVLELGTVRSGLREGDLANITRRLAAGEQPVLQVGFLLARTIGIHPVEPTARLRSDKAPADCTTDQLVAQLGTDRAPLIAAARPWSGPLAPAA